MCVLKDNKHPLVYAPPPPPLPFEISMKGLREKSAMTSAKEKDMDKDGEIQDLAVLKKIKRAAESYEKRAADWSSRKSLFLNGLS